MKRARAAPSAGEVKRAKAVLAAAAKAKKKDKEDAFACPRELLEWSKAGTLHSQLNAMNTIAVKGWCGDCGLRYGGAKYKLVNRLLEHVDEALRREKFDMLRANAEQDPAAAAQLHFSKVKSFNAARNMFAKQFSKLPQQPTAAARLRAMIGLTRGFDIHLLKAITGPNRAKYNGKHGEEGMDGQLEVSTAWSEFLTAQGKELSEADWTLCASFVFEELPTAAYGFDQYVNSDLLPAA